MDTLAREQHKMESTDHRLSKVKRAGMHSEVPLQSAHLIWIFLVHKLEFWTHGSAWGNVHGAFKIPQVRNYSTRLITFPPSNNFWVWRSCEHLSDVQLLHPISEAESRQPFRGNSCQLLVFTISFFQSLPRANGHRWELKYWLTCKSRVQPSGSAPSSSQTVTTLASLLTPHQTTCPSHAPFFHYPWPRPQVI